MEIPGVYLKRTVISGSDQEENVQFPGVLVFDLGISEACNTISWNLQG